MHYYIHERRGTDWIWNAKMILAWSCNDATASFGTVRCWHRCVPSDSSLRWKERWKYHQGQHVIFLLFHHLQEQQNKWNRSRCLASWKVNISARAETQISVPFMKDCLIIHQDLWRTAVFTSLICAATTESVDSVYTQTRSAALIFSSTQSPSYCCIATRWIRNPIFCCDCSPLTNAWSPRSP